MRVRDRLIIAVIAAVVVVGAMWVLLVSPERGQVSSLSSQITAERAALGTAELQAAAARSAANGYVGHLHQIDEVMRAVPQTPAEANVVATIDQLAGQKVDFRTLSLGAGGATASGPTSLTTTFTFWTTYAGLQSFLTSLDNLTQTDGTALNASGRLFTVTNVALVPLGAASGAPVNGTSATITAQAYLQNVPAAPTTAPGGATGATGSAGGPVG